MSLQDMMKSDASVFIDADGFGEPVIYTPRAGTPRTIIAIVDRMPPVRVAADGTAYTPNLTIIVANNATSGISSATLDAAGNDKITVSERIGLPAKTFGVFIPKGSGEFHDEGLLTLDLM